MQIEVHGPQQVMEQIRLMFQDQMEKAGYEEGPKFTSRDTGVLINYTKGDLIVSIQVTEESETKDSTLRVEAEQEIPEIYELWDTALIQFGKDQIRHLYDFAIDKNKVKEALSKAD